jgi:hypothetical protein
MGMPLRTITIEEIETEFPIGSGTFLTQLQDALDSYHTLLIREGGIYKDIRLTTN